MLGSKEATSPKGLTGLANLTSAGPLVHGRRRRGRPVVARMGLERQGGGGLGHLVPAVVGDLPLEALLERGAVVGVDEPPQGSVRRGDRLDVERGLAFCPGQDVAGPGGLLGA